MMKLWENATTCQDAIDLLHEVIRLGEDGEMSYDTALNIIEDCYRMLNNLPENIKKMKLVG